MGGADCDLKQVNSMTAGQNFQGIEKQYLQYSTLWLMLCDTLISGLAERLAASRDF
jgi:hypothetical protein